ncbi:F-box protein At5g07610-like [Impatiens glandulifera]|uniref:F-box protein At5g07610-like n=1 Tax=Impatiens glandulifera TaxID=253017 RepID=UPI001FB12824|nr:F-box protein At5g07610-like [Impatiens glandulifera]
MAVVDSGSCSSLDKVVSNDDLLLEILFRLPVKSLFRFKSVSKHWHSLISNPPLVHLLRHHRRKPSGLLLHWKSFLSLSYLDFLPFNNNHAHDRPFFPNYYDIHYFTSCNGLISWVDSINVFHVMNPTTRQLITLPQPLLFRLRIEGMTLAFDPSKSLHYKLISLWTDSARFTNNPPASCFQIEIYSSETISSRVLVDLNFTWPYRQRPKFSRGTYWNDAIIWFCNYGGDSLYLQIKEERLGTIPRLTTSFQDEGKDICYGESGGHFYVVERSSPSPNVALKVSELMADFSGWVTKYIAELGEDVGRAFPEMIEDQGLMTRFRVLSMVWGGGGGGEEQPYLVLLVPGGKMIRFNLEDKRFGEVCDVGKVTCMQDGKRTYGSTRYTSCRLEVHHYFHSLFNVLP